MQQPGYTVSPWNRPPFKADGTLVCRRAFPSPEGGQYTVGEIVPPERFRDVRELHIYWDQGLVDTLEPPAKPAEPPKKQASSPQRGR